jgi:Putative serine esterase (DUF676)
MAQPSKRWLCSLMFTTLVSVAVVLESLPAHAQGSAVEYDENGHLVAATMPHMYRYAFRVQNAMERFATRAASQGRDGSVRNVLRYELRLPNADFGLFEDAAIRFGAKEEDIRRRIVAARKADWATHPRTWALSEKGIGIVHGLLAEDESELTTDVGILRGSLSAKGAAALDAQVARFYARTMMIGQGGQKPRSSTTLPNSKAPSNQSSVAGSVEAPATSCPTCPLPTVSQGYLTFEPDGSTVDATFEASVSQANADLGCVVTGQFAIDQNGSPVATQDEDGSDGATVEADLSAPVSVGSTYQPTAYVSACNTASGCVGPVIFTASSFQTGPPSITGNNISSVGVGTSGTFTLSGTDLGGPPGNVPTILLSSGSGLDLEADQPTQYNGSGSNLAVGTQAIDYFVDPDASVGQDTYTLSTVWGSTTGSLSVTCSKPSIFNISPTPWTTGTKYNITIGGYGFCTGSTVKVTVPTGTVTVTSPVVVNDETITATVQPNNTTNGESATVTVTNSGGSSQYKVTIQGANVGPLYLVDPYLLSGYTSGTISTATVLGTLPGNLSSAKGLVNDGTSTAIVALQVPTSTTSTTFSVTTGSIAAYATTFLTKAPTTGQTSITVSPVASGSNFYALALVQAPPTPTASSITVTGKTSAGSATGTLTLYAPFVVLAHGLWSNQSALQNVQNYLTSSGYPSNMVISVCYTSLVPWNATGSSGANCTWNSLTAIGKALTDPTTGAYIQYDNLHIVGGRVDYVGHSMGGLAARFYGAQSAYLTNVRDRHQGAIHTFITLDTPAQGSLLANYLISNAQCTVQKNSFYHFERLILGKLGCNTTMTVQQCLFAAGMPLAASGAGVTTGAVYSLEPSYIQGVSYPGKPPNSTWVAMIAQFPDNASPGSFLRDALQRLIANFYGTTNQPAAPCNTTAAPPTLTAELGSTANDVIVTTASQGAGFSQSPNSSDSLIGNLEHTQTPGASGLVLFLAGDSDANVLNDEGVNSGIVAWLKTY